MSNSEQTTKAEQTAEKPKLTPEQREAQRKQALDDAAKKAVSSVTNLRAYLAVQSRFERYSTNNNLLIFAQRPDATRLKSLELWNKEKKLFIRFVLAKAAVTWGLDRYTGCIAVDCFLLSRSTICFLNRRSIFSVCLSMPSR